jgi:hypothetical protein
MGIALLVLLGACSGGDEHAGEASGSSVAASCTLPSCISTFLDMCAPTGVCGTVVVEGGVEYCYENGVSIRSQPFPAGTAIGAYSVNAPDGSNCYIVEVRATDAGVSYTYRVPSSPMPITAAAAANGEWKVDCGNGMRAVLGADCQAETVLLPPSRVSECAQSMTCDMTRGFGR